MVTVIDNICETLTVSLSGHLRVDGKGLQELLFIFHNQFLKSISMRPRRVHISNEIISHPLYLREKKQVIDRIADACHNGKDLEVYLSDKTDQLNHIDLSLAHLGVHHFHLGERIQIKGARAGRVKGTKKLLFCRIEDDDIYFINIYDHGVASGFLNINLMRELARFLWIC